MAGQEKIRINKVLKEFNIGLGTLVEFLNKKGFEVEAHPTAQISAEEYELVKKEYAKEQLIKEESKKIAIKVKEITKKEGPKHEQEDESFDDEVFIKSTTINRHTSPEPAKEKKSETVEESVNAPASPAPVAEQETKASVTEQNNPEKKPAVNDAPAAAKAAEPEADTAGQTAEPAPATVQDRPGHNGPKILGKIDLNKKKPTVQAPQPAPKPTVQPAPAPADKQPARQEVEHIETRVEKLTGPVISGKIDLSAFEKKHSSGQDKNTHRKRERIKGQGEKVDITKADPGNQKNRNKKGGEQNAGKKNKKEKPKPIRVEIDEDQIQKQIKETYARMTESKGKTKSSKHKREKREMISQKMEEAREQQQLESKILKMTEFVTVNELAVMMNIPVTKVIAACMNLGLMVSINQRLEADALVLVAEEFGYEVQFVSADEESEIQEEVDDPADLVERPPIITVMGHVDHGKTSLLDYIRKSNVIAGEAGGITQHIGAYNVQLPDGRRITFLDTPGHEAFTAMRARGAKITDLVIIIVAADDAIMPQTIEAINHAQAAGVPMIFAINKIDKPGANPDRIREQLANMNILVEDWGGKFQCQEISAKKGTNVDKLLEEVLLEADLLELKANPNRKAKGTVIESSLDKGRGYLATVLVQNGTLHVGDIVLSGSYYGRVKAMFNERGQKVDEADPSTPVSVLGLNGAPTAGETFNVMDDEREAKDLANKREQLLRIQGLRTQKHITLEEIGRRIAIGNFKELNIIVKGDVDGSIEALSDSLIKLSTEEIHVDVIHKAVGAISESDVLLAAASNAIIIGFQVRPSASARRLAEKEEIEIRLYSVIYDAINEVKSGIEGMLAPEEKEEVTATAEVRETFRISKVGTIAGCMVKEGKITRSSKVRVIRDGIVVYTGALGSLKRFKDDVKDVAAGMDCGLNIDGYNDIKVGDTIEAYQIVEVKRKL
ncbi:MAG TPA: translation initiation factor IF-2 [Candidatus Coprenecus pullistercoris]|nr:translation initiation factor IF-2 [Candidatus Coprenecus pullistercoris]